MVPRAVRFVKKWYSIAIILYKTRRSIFLFAFVVHLALACVCLSDRLVEQLTHIELLISLFD